MSDNRTIYTIGHSIQDIDTFISRLKMHDINLLADIRTYPGSKRHPQFNQQALELSLNTANISYAHLRSLGGKGKTPPADNTGTTIPFSGYSTYMSSSSFQDGITELETLAGRQAIAYMCAEADWAHCHRALVSDYLKQCGWKVMHILANGSLQEHPERYRQMNLFQGI